MFKILISSKLLRNTSKEIKKIKKHKNNRYIINFYKNTIN